MCQLAWNTGTGTTCTSNSEVTGAALNITTGTNKKDEIFTVNCLDSIDLALKMTF